MNKKGGLMTLRHCDKSAIFVILSSYFKKELVSWYASMQKFKLELDQFGAFSTTWSHEVRLFPVESSFFI